MPVEIPSLQKDEPRLVDRGTPIRVTERVPTPRDTGWDRFIGDSDEDFDLEEFNSLKLPSPGPGDDYPSPGSGDDDVPNYWGSDVSETSDTYFDDEDTVESFLLKCNSKSGYRNG